MNPVHHARSSATRHGGDWREHLPVHAFMDQSKAAFPDVRHRFFLHSADLGTRLATGALGPSVNLRATFPFTGTRSACTGDLVSQHLDEDFGFRPTLDDWLAHLEPPDWATGRRRRLPPELQRFADDPLEAAAKRFGGEPWEYQPVLDALLVPTTLSGHPMARLATMNALGIFVVERIVGPAVETGDGHVVPTRLVAERIVQATLGLIPNPAGIASRVRMQPWMHGAMAAPQEDAPPQD